MAVQPVSDALTQLEAVVDRGLATFMEVGAALLAIRDSGKYRERGHERFEDYCQARFHFSRQRAYQLIDAAEVAQAVSTPVDTAAEPLPPIKNEAQARELARLPDVEAQREVWAEVGPQATREQVREAVNRHSSAPAPKPRPAPVEHVPDAEAGPQWQCAGCNRWYAEDVNDCPECQPTYWPDAEAPARATGPVASPPEPFELPPAHLSAEQKAFYQIAKCVHMTGMDPAAIAATPSAVIVGPSINELGNLAAWLTRVVEALRDRQERPDLRAVK